MVRRSLLPPLLLLFGVLAGCSEAVDDRELRFVVQAHENCFLPDGSGNPPAGDADEDGFCDDEDTCPFIANNQLEDADGDGVGDRCDPCFGDETTGDADIDGYCADTDCNDRNKDVYPGAEEICDGVINDCDGTELPADEDDSDGDTVPDCADLCEGADGFGDRDEDGLCEDIDLCLGDNETGDLDGDGICGDRDLCEGADSSGDEDGDGVCEDIDVCLGDDDTGDSDGDGVCGDRDACAGDDTAGDSDEDGVCDDRDLCEGDDAAGDADDDGFCADVDCDDGARERYPGAEEACDGRDDDCDRVLDNDAPCEAGFVCAAGACTQLQPCFADVDGDGFGDAADVILERPGTDCTALGRVANGLDCDDDPLGCGAGCSPDGVEACDGQDHDCDGDVANDADALCTDPENGSATCREALCVVSCDDGYLGEGESCVDIDECAGEAPPECPPLAECENLVGSVTCRCIAGATEVDGLCQPDCGDGLLLTGEACDDGNRRAGDGCDAACALEAGWVCDPACAPLCGDGRLRGGEVCDDGNLVAGDGCSEACAVEQLWTCVGEPSVCSRTSICGNGELQAGETCDDGNLFDEDGCDSACAVETGWVCVSVEGQPTECSLPSASADAGGSSADAGGTVAGAGDGDGDGSGGCSAARGAGSMPPFLWLVAVFFGVRSVRASRGSLS